MVKIGIVGIGNMGTAHAMNLFEGKVQGAELVAICDVKQDRLDWAKETFNNQVKTYLTIEELIQAKVVDALIIATPHYDHPTMAIQTLKADLHVLVEKPIGVYTKAVEELNKVAKSSDKVFAIMYNQRTNPVYREVKRMIDGGELGELIRVNWTITNWFRSEMYYNSGGWRATWLGEGGGVLLNQSPHQLDLIHWLCGMPTRVRGFCDYGKFHDIEVEDDVTAFFQYENGATGLFVTSTGEAPGTNRLEISGDLGKVIVENDTLKFFQNQESLAEFTKTSKTGFDQPKCVEKLMEVEGEETGHVGIMENFVKTIEQGQKQISPGVEGINGLTISNAIHLSSWTDDWVGLPLDAELFKKSLDTRISESTIVKQSKDIVLDVKGSH